MPPPPPQLIRVVDLETTGPAPPAHGVCEIGWQDVALGADGQWELHGEGGSRLVNPGRQIPPITQAIHHILDEQVAEAPYWHDVARAVLDPWPRRLALARIAPISSSNIAPPPSLATLIGYARGNARCGSGRIARASPTRCCATGASPRGSSMSAACPPTAPFPTPMSRPSTCATCSTRSGLPQLIEWSNLPGLLPRVRQGPDRGKDWREIEDESLARFLGDRDIDVRFTAETELARRRGGGAVGRTTLQGALF